MTSIMEFMSCSIVNLPLTDLSQQTRVKMLRNAIWLAANFLIFLQIRITNFLIAYVKSKQTLELFARLKIVKLDTKLAYII